MKEQVREDSHILAAAEKQMRQWSLTQELTERAATTTRVDQPHHQLGDYITISREAGAGGSTVAMLVGQRLGWEVLDKNLVDLVAERFNLSKPMLELADETSPNWAFDMFGPWLDRKIITHEKFVVRLGRIILAAARRGNVVMVGRGARFLLPRDHGLAVRLVASDKFRIENLMQCLDCSETEARQRMERIDTGRREFAKRYFHHDIGDPSLYDMVLRVDRLGVEGAAELIAEAYPRWYSRQRTPAPAAVAGV